jgi:predicted hydrocarbon binding protein
MAGLKPKKLAFQRSSGASLCAYRSGFIIGILEIFSRKNCKKMSHGVA